MRCEINYSIIIPHKNIPELLRRCLNSIPRRKDIQIVIVDDNSDSDKVNFDKFPGLGDLFTEVVFTKEGKGAGYARNVGLTRATGKWVLFADADDYFTDGLLQCLDRYCKSEYDLIYFGINGINADTKRENSRGRKYGKLMYNAIYNKKYDLYKYKAYVPWGKIIKRSLISENNIKYDETIVANDMMFSKKTAYYAKEIFFDEQKIYTLESRKGSLTGLQSSEAKFDRFFVYVRVNSFLKSIKKEKYKTNITVLFLRLINIRNMAYFCKGTALLKENNINLLLEISVFCLSVPYRISVKIWNKVMDRVCE